jgi:DMSO reductase family type II enzyme chaperone
MGTLEDLVRFYSCFGLCRAEQPNDMPDHLSAQLEFMHYLSYGEAMLCSEGDDPADYRRGQRDFLLHHTAQWLVKLKNTLIENDAADFFLELATLLQGFINLHAQHLIAQVGRGTQDITIPLTTIDDQPTKWADEAELES